MSAFDPKRTLNGELNEKPDSHKFSSHIGASRPAKLVKDEKNQLGDFAVAPEMTAPVGALVGIFCGAFLLIPAFWNGFPLLQYDTGGYLARWFEGTLVPSRAVG